MVKTLGDLRLADSPHLWIWGKKYSLSVGRHEVDPFAVWLAGRGSKLPELVENVRSSSWPWKSVSNGLCTDGILVLIEHLMLLCP